MSARSLPDTYLAFFFFLFFAVLAFADLLATFFFTFFAGFAGFFLPRLVEEGGFLATFLLGFLPGFFAPAFFAPAFLVLAAPDLLEGLARVFPPLLVVCFLFFGATA